MNAPDRAEALRIRQANTADAAAILALEALFPGDRLSARSVRDILRSPSAGVLIAERIDGDRPILGNLVLLLPARRRGGRIYSVVVRPDARGQRIGERLVRAAEARAREAGREHIALEVRHDNAAALALYHRLGYRIDRTLPAYYDDGADGLRLRKPLREPLHEPLVGRDGPIDAV